MKKSRAFLTYDREACVTVAVPGWCWRCLSSTLIERTIPAYLLTEDGVSSRLVRWRECRTCGKQGRAESEDP